MLNDVDILKLVADVLDGSVAFDVANAVLLELVVEDPFGLFALAGVPRFLVPHDDGTEEAVLLLFPFKEGEDHVLKFFVLNVGNVDFELQVPLVFKLLQELMQLLEVGDQFVEFLSLVLVHYPHRLDRNVPELAPEAPLPVHADHADHAFQLVALQSLELLS